MASSPNLPPVHSNAEDTATSVGALNASMHSQVEVGSGRSLGLRLGDGRASDGQTPVRRARPLRLDDFLDEAMLAKLVRRPLRALADDYTPPVILCPGESDQH